MTLTFLSSLNLWHWFILGIGLIVIEMMAPGAIFLWLGVAAFGTGIILAIAGDLTWEHQIIVFAVLAALSVYLGRRFVSSRPTPSDHPDLNRRGAHYIGRTYVLVDALEQGEGKLKIDDTPWRISGSDSPAGTSVKVVGMEGNTLLVEPLKEN